MAHIGINLGGQEDKKQPTTQNPAAQGSTATGAGTTTKPQTAPSAGAGINTNPSRTSGVKGGFLGNSGNKENGFGEIETAEQRAKTSLAQLRDDYSKTLREQYNYSADKLKAERDAALRENWILQQQAEATLPEKMAAGGINGGANATSLAALRAMYQGNRNDIQSGYMDNLGDLQQQQSAEQAEVQKDYNERWIEYLLSLAKEEGGR